MGIDVLKEFSQRGDWVEARGWARSSKVCMRMEGKCYYRGDIKKLYNGWCWGEKKKHQSCQWWEKKGRDAWCVCVCMPVWCLSMQLDWANGEPRGDNGIQRLVFYTVCCFLYCLYCSCGLNVVSISAASFDAANGPLVGLFKRPSCCAWECDMVSEEKWWPASCSWRYNGTDFWPGADIVLLTSIPSEPWLFFHVTKTRGKRKKVTAIPPIIAPLRVAIRRLRFMISAYALSFMPGGRVGAGLKFICVGLGEGWPSAGWKFYHKIRVFYDVNNIKSIYWQYVMIWENVVKRAVWEWNERMICYRNCSNKVEIFSSYCVEMHQKERFQEG